MFVTSYPHFWDPSHGPRSLRRRSEAAKEAAAKLAAAEEVRHGMPGLAWGVCNNTELYTLSI